MSLKDVQEQQRRKKASDVTSLGHEDKSAQSISSSNSHIVNLKNDEKRLGEGLEHALSRIDHFRKLAIRF
jgi:hypothetical protein